MSDERILETIRLSVAELCAVDPSAVQDDGKLVGYGLDSLRAMELVLILEEEFGVELPEHDPELGRVETPRQLADLVARRRGDDGP